MFNLIKSEEKDTISRNIFTKLTFEVYAYLSDLEENAKLDYFQVD